MSVQHAPVDDSRLLAAVSELRDRIAARYPEATFEVTSGDDPAGLYLIPTIDVDDTEEVAVLIEERLLALQVDEELPVYVFPVRQLARVLVEQSMP
jgi:hypothetical protein